MILTYTTIRRYVTLHVNPNTAQTPLNFNLRRHISSHLCDHNYQHPARSLVVMVTGCWSSVTETDSPWHHWQSLASRQEEVQSLNFSRIFFLSKNWIFYWKKTEYITWHLELKGWHVLGKFRKNKAGASWVRRVGNAESCNFSSEFRQLQLQIFDRKDYGCLKFQFCCDIFQKNGFWYLYQILHYRTHISKEFFDAVK